MFKKKFIFDLGINIFASSIPIIVLQFIILPLIGREYQIEEYGTMITIYSIITLVAVSFGNVLNNVRLIMNKRYIDFNLEGDFKIILYRLIAISMGVLLFFLIFFFNEKDIFLCGLIMLISTLTILREYFIVEFRLNLNYFAILMNNVYTIFGYIIGLGIFYITLNWQIIYICGLSASLIYIYLKSNLFREKAIKTVLYNETKKNVIVLSYTSILNHSITYFDKILLYPVLGSEAVSIYYASTLFGKAISMILTPVSSVMLSYFSKMEHFKNKHFMTILLSSSALGLLFLICFLPFSSLFFRVLYPQWVDEIMRYVNICTLGSIITMVIAFINPIILKFRNIKWQGIVNTIIFFIYLLFSFVFIHIWGLYGFCVLLVIVNLIKLFLMILIFYFTK